MSRAQRRVPQQMDDSMNLWRGLTLNDGLLFAPSIFVALGSAVGLRRIAPILAIPGLVVAGLLALGGVVAYLTTPPHYESTEWVILHASHRLRPSEYGHITHHFEHSNREQQDEADYDLLKSVWGTNQRTQDVLDISKVHPGGDAHGETGYLQRPDATLLGTVRVHPANLSLATHDDWNTAVESFASVVNTLDFEIQIYRTTRELDIEQFLSSYQARRGHDDVRNDPELETLLENFLAWYPSELQTRGTKMIEYYAVVQVTEDEVTSDRRTRGLKDQIAEWPILSFFISDDDDDDDVPDAVLRGRQREKLHDRLEMVKFQIKDISGVDAERVSAAEHADVLKRAYRQESEVSLADQLQTNGVTTRAEPPQSEANQ